MTQPIASSLKLDDSFSSRAEAEKYVSSLVSILVAKGYFSASVDSVHFDSSYARIWLYAGEKYQWRSLRFDSTAAYWINRMPGKMMPGKESVHLSPDSLRSVLLAFLATKGYPFARVRWDSVLMDAGAIDALLLLDTGPPYKLDSVVQHGNARMNRSFIYRFLQLQPGMPYNQQLLEVADTRLEELPFVLKTKPSDIQMLGTGSTYHVYLDTKRSNVFNALIGAMPASEQTPGSSLLITGDVNLRLQNALGTGETIGANWQQIQYKSPRINMVYQQPYMLSSRAGVDFEFDLFRKDTQFLNLQFRLGIPYQINHKQMGKVFYQHQQNNVTYTDTNWVKQNKALPDLADFTISNLGIAWEYNSTDYRFNPRSGVQADLVGLGGLKSIRKKDEITNLKDPSNPDFDYSDLYDTVQLRTYQLRVRGGLSKFFPMGLQSTLKSAVQAGWLQSANYYRNELFQIGGYKLLRGFDEESVYARNYLVGTLEYRYLTGRNSYLSAFTDAGLAQYKDQMQQYSHSYIGGGLGIHFETKNAVVNLSWAVGKRNDLPFDMRQSKIHLGFVNFF